MEIFEIRFQVFSLLFARFLAGFSIVPFLGGQALSYFYRIALSFSIALLIIPWFILTPEVNKYVADNYFLVLAEQIFIGLFIGMSLVFLVAGFQTAGEFFSVQMGFGINEVLDPVSQTSLPIMGILKNLMAIYVFFISSSHILFIEAITFSYQTIPISKQLFISFFQGYEHHLEFIIFLMSSVFVIGIKLAFPVMGALLLVSLTLGFLSKAAPQMNVLILGFPIKIYLAFIILTFIADFIIQFMSTQFNVLFQHLHSFLSKLS